MSRSHARKRRARLARQLRASRPAPLKFQPAVPETALSTLTGFGRLKGRVLHRLMTGYVDVDVRHWVLVAWRDTTHMQLAPGWTYHETREEALMDRRALPPGTPSTLIDLRRAKCVETEHDRQKARDAAIDRIRAARIASESRTSLL
jgi:hypothetical protein